MSTVAEQPGPPYTEASSLAGIVQTIVAGLLCGFLALVLSISFGSLLLPPSMSAHLPAAIGMALFSTAVVAVISALTSPMRGAVSVVQEIPLVATAGMVAPLVAGLLATKSPEDLLVTVVAACAACTMATGLVLYLLGHFRLGRLVRFVPFPVIAGFLASSGWLIVRGGLDVAAGHSTEFSELFTPEIALKGAFSVAFVGAVVLIRLNYKTGLALPIVSLFAVVAFNLAVLMADIPQESLRAAGWIVPLPGDGSLWPPIQLATLDRVEWSVVLYSLLSVPSIAGLTLMALLMNATGIELDSRTDIDLDRELRSVGLQNLGSGVGGGLPGYPSISLTVLARRFGATNRGTGLIVGLMAVGTLILGDRALGLVPTPLLGALLFYVGGNLMVAWLAKPIQRVSAREYAIILLIFVVTVTVGFPLAILVGLLSAAGLFIIEYGRIDTVRYVLRGSEYQSNFEGAVERNRFLKEHGDAIIIVRLQGYLFFGSAERLRQRILAEVGAKPGTRARSVALDCDRVPGMDSSAVLSFVRLVQAARRHGFVMIVNAREDLRDVLSRGELAEAGDVLRFADTMQQAISACEDSLIAELAPDILDRPTADLHAFLRQFLKGDEDIGELTHYFERIAVAPGDRLISEGDPSDDIFFIEAGCASVSIRSGDAELRLARIVPGGIVGEVTFFAGGNRTATVSAEEPLVAWRFSRKRLEALQLANPKLAFRLHHGLSSMLAGRLASTNRLVRLLAS